MFARQARGEGKGGQLKSFADTERRRAGDRACRGRRDCPQILSPGFLAGLRELDLVPPAGAATRSACAGAKGD